MREVMLDIQADQCMCGHLGRLSVESTWIKWLFYVQLQAMKWDDLSL